MDEQTKEALKRRIERMEKLLDSASRQADIGSADGVALFAEYLEQQATSLRKEAVNAAH
jgi:hypothetical protein